MIMKKLATLLVAMLFTAGMAFAQSNSATVDQNGNGNDVVAAQNGSLNDVMLLQQVKDNQADIVQTGNGNILQNSMTGSKPGYPGYAVQRATALLDLDQVGDGNVVGLFQNNQKNRAFIEQIGDANVADVSQVAFGGTVNGNETDLSQDGSNNMTQVIQGISGGNHSDNFAIIDIDGDGNGDGSAGDLYMLIEQYGDFNEANAIIVDSDYNDTDILQNGGDRNFAIANAY